MATHYERKIKRLTCTFQGDATGGFPLAKPWGMTASRSDHTWLVILPSCGYIRYVAVARPTRYRSLRERDLSPKCRSWYGF